MSIDNYPSIKVEFTVGPSEDYDLANYVDADELLDEIIEREGGDDWDITGYYNMPEPIEALPDDIRVINCCFDYIDFVERCPWPQKVVDALMEELSTPDADDLRDFPIYGRYNSDVDFARSWLEDAGSLAEVPDSLRNHVDWQSWFDDSEFWEIGDTGYYTYSL